MTNTHPHLEGLIRKWRDRAEDAKSHGQLATFHIAHAYADELEAALSALPGGGVEVVKVAATPRYVVQKAAGSRYAFVHDTAENKNVQRYDIFIAGGWDQADRHAARLNELNTSTPSPHEADPNG